MKEKLKSLWKKHWKPIIILAFVLFISIISIIISKLDTKDNPVEVMADGSTLDAYKTEELEISTEPTTLVTDVAETTGDNVTNKEEEISINKTTTNSQIEKPTIESVTTSPTEFSVQEINYIPISEGWKDSKSASGNIKSTQKNDLDCLVESWKSGALSDSELKEKIVQYLNEQGITFMEVSVTSKGYALYDVLPEIDLKDGGNLYSFIGTYSTGKQNPDGTNKTVCYNWSAFVF